MSKTVLILCSDLLFSSNLHNAARQAGLQSRTALKGDQALKLLQEESFGWVVIDLEMLGVDLPQIQQAAHRQAGCRTVAFGPHVHEQLFEQARSAGVQIVLTRGQASSGLASILAERVE